MEFTSTSEQQFVNRLTEIIDTNQYNEQYCISVLAREMGINRINLHRKIKAAYHIPASRFISQLRLNRAHELLAGKHISVTQTGSLCGFHSMSYFDKRFHYFYWYPPGDFRKNKI